MALTTWLLLVLMVLSVLFDGIALMWHHQDRNRMTRDEARLTADERQLVEQALRLSHDEDEAIWHGRTNDS